MVERKATFSVHDAAEQRLIIVEQSFVYLKDIVATVLYEILHNNVSQWQLRERACTSR